ncbi:MAG: hypothetical protein JEY99_20260 [Spirochaetales bacterium]|nr:hypothetical protein [Spirochaetales bacterium]
MQIELKRKEIKRGVSGRLPRTAWWTEGEPEKRDGKRQAAAKGILPLSKKRKTAKDGSILNTYNTIDKTYTPDPYGLIHKNIQTGAGASKEITYTYDGRNRLTNITSPSGTETSYTYNSLNQLTSVPGITGG